MRKHGACSTTQRGGCTHPPCPFRPYLHTYCPAATPAITLRALIPTPTQWRCLFLPQLPRLEQELLLSLLPKDDADSRGVVVEVRRLLTQALATACLGGELGALSRRADFSGPAQGGGCSRPA